MTEQTVIKIIYSLVSLYLLTSAVAIVITAFVSKQVIKRTPNYGKEKKINKWYTAIASAISFLLLLRFGLEMPFIKGTALLLIFLYAAVSDIQTRHLSDGISVMVLLVGLIDVSVERILVNFVSALAVFLFMFGCAVFSKNKIGGADVKFITANTFVLGFSKGVFGLAIGLILSVIGTAVRNKISKINDKTLPMIPYLSIVYLIMYLVENIV